MTMIDEKLVEAVARAICTAGGGLPDMTALPIFPEPGEGPEPIWRRYIPEARAAITAYEAAKAQALALLVTPDRGRRVEHPMPAKPAAEPVAGCKAGDRVVINAAVGYASPSASCALSAPASKDGG